MPWPKNTPHSAATARLISEKMRAQKARQRDEAEVGRALIDAAADDPEMQAVVQRLARRSGDALVTRLMPDFALNDDDGFDRDDGFDDGFDDDGFRTHEAG